ncbi:hypothetical protein [Tardiphaga sp. 709]|uniref:hypothetical protein n=1 Tax=Tardiphaga sp. 709 TaxID=3076039 RepID=UPI0028EA1ACD|nr:hypothetical protein [Tardiphaga sp. 709]WNV08310.1 hypothetical protein RSO67_22870 [Tardiphaga sp. 709]
MNGLVDDGRVMSDQKPKINLEINQNRMAQIIGAAVVQSTEVVGLHFEALKTFDLSQPPPSDATFYRFNTPNLNADQRRQIHESWILAKAFQELLRAVRHALEEAHLLVALLTKAHTVRSSETLSVFLKPFQRKAAGLPFWKLMEDVNECLVPKLDFADSYKSLQAARNCLEHRAGVITNVETKGASSFELQTPRMKVFYLRGSTEVEIVIGEAIDSQDDRSEVDVFAKLQTRSRSIPLGERLSFNLAEFNEVAFACNYLGQQLSARLPRPITQIEAE